MELRATLLGAVVAIAVGACGNPPPGDTFFDRNIKPILQQKCAGNTSGCHSTNPEDAYQFAAGNFDVTSYENVNKRRDVLKPFGAYPYPLILIKAVGPNVLSFSYDGQTKKIEVQHAGLAVLSSHEEQFQTLQTWLQNGATEDGVAPATPAQTGNGGCSSAVPSTFDPTTYKANANFGTFKDKVQPILKQHGCVSSNCHGAPQSDFYITCGDDDNQLAFNFSQAWSFVNMPVEDSQILKVPLAPSAGGRGHTGGDQFASRDDDDYKTIRDWASSVGVLDFAMGDPVKQFFKDNVQPVLIQRGCSFQACHSPDATNDFKLRSGTTGFFSAISLQRNYDLLKGEFMAIEFPDARRGRAVAKAILFDDPRIPDQVAGFGTDTRKSAHRGGAVLDAPACLDPIECPASAADPAACGTFVPGTSSPFCTIQEWITRERGAIATQVTSMNANDTINIVYVERPTGQTAGRLEFDTFQGNADLKVVQATFGAGFGGNLTVTGTPQSLLADASCAAIANGDIQAPDVAGDGNSVAFAARGSANVPLSIWTVSIATGTCTQVTPAAPDSNGLKVHNFDPAWSPDGAYIVFASTRGKSGALKSRKRFLPQSDLWRIHLADSQLEQMTFLSNSEISPQFMREGRVTMTTEKASDGFYQLSGRRINWDLTDYHPLLAQRNVSAYADLTDLTVTKTSIGYSSATDIREGADGNFLMILSDLNADGSPVLRGGAGQLAVFNRSIGPFEMGRIDPGYLASVRLLDPAASGRTGAPSGYRSPVTMPDGQIMVSYAPSATALDWKIVAFNSRTGARTDLIVAGGGRAAVDAVLAYKYPVRPFYTNRRQLVFGGGTDGDTAHATLHMPDAPMVFTMLTGNLRRGRPVENFRNAQFLAIYSEGTCPPSGCTGNTQSGVFQSRNMLGKAPLAADGSVKVAVPSGTGIVLELQDGNGTPVITMGEEHQLGPGEEISMGVSEQLFDAVCGGCHGSVTGHELDIAVTPDALTGASQSMASTAAPVGIGN